MPRIKASLADVSTEFTPVEPGAYEAEITDVAETTNEGRTHYDVTLTVKDPGDFFGRKIRDRIYIHKKDGDLNEYGLVQLKRYFEATVGEDRANADDADTDELLHQHAMIQVGIDGYEVENKLTGKTEKRQVNRVEAIAPVG